YRLGGSNRETREEMIQRIEEEQARKAQEYQEAAERRAEEAARPIVVQRVEEGPVAEELVSALQRIEELIAATPVRNGRVDRVTGDGGRDALRVNFDGDILFASGRYNLNQNAVQVLVPLAQILQENPHTTIDVFGHTDNVGSLRYNQRLSSRRANAVVDFLTDMGVDRRQVIRVVGRNFSEPVADNSTKAGRAQNRRVEIWMYAD
ncbi:MAG: OmpA family protein, partial [Bacteroidales bacterium]|nr:OmpA family protein [Bacteroidales bacterium]